VNRGKSGRLVYKSYSNRLRTSARTIALLWAGWWTLFGFLRGISEGLDFLGVFIHAALPGFLLLAAVVIAWRRELAGGVLLLLGGLLILAFFASARTLWGFPIISLPPLVSGGLFLLTGTRPGRPIFRARID